MKFTIMASQLKQVLSILSEVENEMRFELKTDGLYIRAVDPANAAMIDININSSSFVQWDIENDIDVGVDVFKFKNLISDAGKMSDVSVSIGDKMKVSFDGMNYNLSMLDPSTLRAKPRVPELDLPIKINIDLDIIKSILKGVTKIDGEIVNIITDGNELKLYSDSKNGLDDITSDPIEIDGNFEKSESMYSLDYLKLLNLLNGEISMKYNSNMPIVFEYEKDGIKLFYMIAPRISTD